MKGKENLVLAVDLGGTKIYSAVVDSNGKIIGAAKKRTKAELGFEAVVSRILDCLKEALDNAGVDLNAISAVGIGSPGPLDLKKGVIIETPNLGWKNAPLKQRIETALEKPVVVDNDGNVGLLGEYFFGAAHKAQHAVGLFVGTGIGGGIIIDGKLLHGFNENAAELGHMILDPEGPLCGCGRRGCLEAFSSRTAIERDIRAAAAEGVKTTLIDPAGNSEERIRSKKLAQAFKMRDPAAVQAIEKSARYLGYGIANLLNMLNPQVVVVGGGVVEALKDDYLDLVKKTAFENVFPVAARNVEIVRATLGDDSAVLGAAMLAFELTDLSAS